MKTYIIIRANKRAFETKCGEKFEITDQGFKRSDGQIFKIQDNLGPKAPTVFRVAGKEYRSPTEA